MNQITTATLSDRLRAVGRRFFATPRGVAQSTRRIAEDAQAYWSGSTTDEDLRDLSHWAGEGRWSELDRWKQIGRTHFGMFRTLCELAGVAQPAGRMLEWGPGGGANAVRFAETFDTFVGVDISESNLDECGRRLTAVGYEGYQPVLIDAAEPESVTARVAEPIDFFLCTAVYQHFPGREYGERVTRAAAAMLAPEGLALIQTRYPSDDPATASKRSDYCRNVLQFTAYRVAEFWTLARRCGLEPMMVKLVETDRYAYYFLRKAREATR
jgi:2-polyprenyl-3-methyl-5-hydroxy-6-metoxy-1,4-benzoquinol methylase